MANSTSSVGFIGLGQMGMPLAVSLARRGHEVVAFDKSPEVVTAFSGVERFTASPSIGDLTGRAEIVLTCLPDEQAVHSVYLEEGGILQNIRPGLVTCDLSTTPPDLTKQIHSKLQEGGGLHFDVPVFGSHLDAEAAEVFFAVSGSESSVDRIEPLLSAMGRGFRYVGEPGTASLMKILQNSLGYGYAIVTAEILTLCSRQGADAAAFARLVKDVRAMGWSKYFDLYAEDIIAGSTSGTGRLHIAAKDTQLLKAMIDETGFDAPVLEQAIELFREAVDQGLGQKEFTAVTRLVEDNNRQK